MVVSEEERRAYYRGALRALQFVEARRPTGRRFGADAEARWRSFKSARGHLATADRIDLLIRDADAEWPAAFGARAVYDLRAVAQDEAFGSEWQTLDPVAAEEMWRAVTAQAAPESPAKALGAIAGAWGIELGSADAPTIAPTIAPTDVLVVAGPSAIAAVVVAFAEGQGLDWHQQVRVVATAPAARQLAAAGAALVNAAKATRLHGADASADPSAGATLVLSADAAEADATEARRLVAKG